MKKVKLISLILIGSLCAAITFTSCKKKDESPPAPTYGTLAFHLHTMADTVEVDAYGDTITMTGGRQIIVDSAQMYISNVRLIKTDGSVVNAPSTVVLLKQGLEEYTVGSVLTGNYKSVRFDVGLSNAANGMNGFAFINFQGKIDTTNAKDGSGFYPFIYEIGTAAHLTTVTMPDMNYTVVPNQIAIEHLLVDYAHLFNGVTLNHNNLMIMSATDNTTSLATQVAANITGMFKYE